MTDENFLKRLANMQTQTKELVPDSFKENGKRRMRQDDTYEFIGVWDERYKRVGFEADNEGRPIEQLIRCKECDNWDCNNVGGASAPCYEWSDLEDGIIIYTDAYEFCSRAERKEE